MNNAKLAIDFVEEQFEAEKAPIIRQRQEEVVKIIECLQHLANSNDWKTLKVLVFDGLVVALEQRLKLEATKKIIDVTELNILNGQLMWAKRYSDLYKLIDVYKLELNSLKDKLNAS